MFSASPITLPIPPELEREIFSYVKVRKGIAVFTEPDAEFRCTVMAGTEQFGIYHVQEWHCVTAYSKGSALEWAIGTIGGLELPYGGGWLCANRYTYSLSSRLRGLYLKQFYSFWNRSSAIPRLLESGRIVAKCEELREQMLIGNGNYLECFALLLTALEDYH